MEWWQILLIGIASIIVGTSFRSLTSYLIKRFVKEDKTTAAIEGQLKYPASGILEEVKANLQIATEPRRGVLIPFETRMWNILQEEINELPVDLQEELLQTYIDIRLANSIVRLSVELGRVTDDLTQNYIKLCNSIAERLHRIKLSIEVNTSPRQIAKPPLALENITSIKFRSEFGAIELVLYFAAITAAEIVSTFYIPQWGLLSHAIILTIIIIHSALTQDSVHQRLLLPLALVPLLRIVSLISLLLPLGEIPPMLLYYLSYALVFAAAMAIANIFGYTATQVGVSFKRPLTQLLVGLTGIVFGLLQYFILVPRPIISELTWQEAWLPALVLLVSAGFMQEFVFRGLLQSSITTAYGWLGIVYISLVFAVTHIGFIPLIDIVFVFGVAVFFGWTVRKTGSILGVALSYGICNILLYLIIPFFF